MQTVTVRRTLLVLVLGAALLLPAAALAAPPVHPALAAGSSLFQDLWGLLVTLWNGAGSDIDPNGGRLAPAGADIDPDGNRAGDRLVPLWDEEGADIDPDGYRAPSPPPATDYQEAGSSIVPDGGR